METIKAGILAGEGLVGLVTVRRHVNEGDPESLSEPPDWPTNTQVLVHLMEGDLAESGDARERDSFNRWQRVTAYLKWWIYDRDEPQGARATRYSLVRRQLLDAIEAVGDAHPHEEGNWSIDWTEAPILRGPKDLPPYAGGRIFLAVRIWE